MSTQQMNIDQILGYLPHRYPFLLVDRVLEFERDKTLLAVKNVTINEPFFSGHFPSKAVMPGVLIVEALAQAAAILASYSTGLQPQDTLFYLGSIENARFKRVVIPGDQLHLKVEVQRRRAQVWKFKGTATVAGEVACIAEMTSAEGKEFSIDRQAIIDPNASIAANVQIGPWSFIGPDVEIDEGTWVGSHVVIRGPTRIGKGNKIYQYATIGEDSPDKKYGGEPTWLEIGDRNIFRECCTVHRGTVQGGGVTRIGNDNLFMAYTHVAHDCTVGNQVVFSNNASVAGHVRVDDYACLGGMVGVHQFCAIGAHSFAAGGAIIVKDVPPFVMVSGHPAEAHGLNSVGLERRGYNSNTIAALKRAYKIVFRQSLTLQEAILELKTMIDETPEIGYLIDFLSNSTRGIVR